MHLETLAIHAGHDADPTTGAVAPPIYLTTTFERAEDGSFPHGYVYARTDNPNRQALEARLAALEGGAAALAFASGSAATLSLCQALRPGDHVVAPNDAYYGTAAILRQILGPWGLETTFVDMTDLAQVEEALRPTTRLVWTETPSNPLLRITDIAAAADLAHRVGARLLCDNTWATPVLQRPLDLGADIAMHSTTKYLGGHADVTGGILVARQDDEFFERVRLIQRNGGGIPSPFDCGLVQRGITTLAVRVRAHCENARRVAEFLSEHPRIERVHYPGLPSHPGHDIASRQMALPGGMLSIQVRGGRDAAMAVAGRVRLFTRATSLGGVESLIEHRASVEGPGTRTPDNLLRVSVGLEHPDDLIADLAQALS
ncbi:MAG: aminotransferase class V-fold PLP-dependent enzyme [Anaerolineae bacterium]|nr:aminotransferase class V-fold PLP-dependent enzyme [Anaerolineae bacterium]